MFHNSRPIFDSFLGCLLYDIFTLNMADTRRLVNNCNGDIASSSYIKLHRGVRVVASKTVSSIGLFIWIGMFHLIYEELRCIAEFEESKSEKRT
jgi:hypothetical protein